MLRIRTATAADADSVARIHVYAWQTTYRGLMPADVLADLDVAKGAQRWRDVAESCPAQLFVLEDDDQVLGFCHIAPAGDTDANESIGEITALYLDPSASRCGYGRRLCDHALDRLREQGFTEVILWVLRDNHAARAFYERLGFALDGAHKFLEELKVKGVRYRIRLGE